MRDVTPFRLMLGMAAMVVVLLGVHSASAVITPLILSLLIAMICQPVLNGLEKIRVPRWLGGIVVLCSVALAGIVMGKVLLSSVTQIAQKMPVYQAQFELQLLSAFEFLAQKGIALDTAAIISSVEPGKVITWSISAMSHAGTAITQTFLLLLIVVFMLMEAANLPGKLKMIFPGAQSERNALFQFTHAVEQYLLIKTGTSAVTGLLIGAGLHLLDVQYATLWGVLAFLLNFIPTIGSIIAAIPAIVLSLIDGGLSDAVMVSGIFLLVNVLIGNVVEPRVMGRGLGLSPLVVFLSLLIWGALLGPVGMLLSVPLTMMVKIALSSHPDTENWAVLLAEKAPVIPIEQDAPRSDINLPEQDEQRGTWHIGP